MQIFFNFFSILSIFSALLVIVSLNPIVSLLYLIATFINISIILILLGYEFFGLIFIAIYAGAIAVLFLFILMMINIPYFYPKRGFFYEVVLLFILFCILLLLTMHISNIQYFLINNLYSSLLILFNHQYSESLELISALLYTQYGFFVILAGILLLIAMFGSIMIFAEYKFTYNSRRYYKQVYQQKNQ
jgi:NADH-quinone oxidoreductase subunit J